MNLELGKEYIDQIIGYISVYGLNVLGAIAIFFIGKWIARRIKNLLRKTFIKTRLDATLSDFFSNVVYALLIAFIVIAALNKVGVETTSLAAVVGAIGLAIGLAFQGSISNVAAGVMLVVLRPFKVGHFVEVAGVSGNVDNIDIMTTNLTTPDNKKIIIPNSKIFDEIIINYTAQKMRRIDLKIGIGYDDDIKLAKQVMEDVVKSDERVLKDPEPMIGVIELGESSVNIVLRPWVKTDDYWPAYMDITENVKLRFDEEGITIPYPQREITQKVVMPDAVKVKMVGKKSEPKKPAAKKKSATKKPAKKK